MKKMVIAGGTGYLGQLIQSYFKNAFEIYVLTRSKRESKEGIHYVQWDAENLADWANTLESADVVINLTGRNINTRFTKENKKAILESRVKSTDVVGKAISQCKIPPKMWLNASSIAVFKDSVEQFDENSEERGVDFLSTVSQEWEKAFYKYDNGSTKKAIFRISLIMGNHKGSAYQSLKKIVKLGGGGKAGNGQQMVSWLGETDFVRALGFIIQKELTGAFNFCNETAISNAELMRQLRKKYSMPIGFPAPKCLIKIGANLIGTAPDLVLRSQNVYPKRLIENGFSFQQTTIFDI